MIKVEPDVFDGHLDPGEPCCLCGHTTRFWFTPKDVACCPSCAEHAAVGDIPSKRDWLNANLRPGEAALPPEWKSSVDKAARKLPEQRPKRSSLGKFVRSG